MLQIELFVLLNVAIPFTSSVPLIFSFPPTFKDFAIPTPPEITNEPLSIVDHRALLVFEAGLFLCGNLPYSHSRVFITAIQ